MHDARRFAPATERNRDAILEVMRRFVSPGARVLEVASGSGEHAVFLAPRLEVALWQPSDPDAESRASIDAWRAIEADERVLPALELDVTQASWPTSLPERPDAIVAINMIHIAPWRACEGLMSGAGRLLEAGGVLFLYGPFRRAGVSTAPSNEAFDESLRARNPEWGVRDLDAVRDEAADHGLVLEEVVAMPANNLSVVLRRAVAGAILPG
jgi:cyclopropane fatty-acyl-phospholipid synthase-like methyltransferase